MFTLYRAPYGVHLQVFEASWERLQESSAAPLGCSAGSARGRERDQLLGRRVFRSAVAFLQPATLWPLLLLSALFVAQQLSGTYVIIFYAVPLFAEIGSRIGTVSFGTSLKHTLDKNFETCDTATPSSRFRACHLYRVSNWTCSFKC